MDADEVTRAALAAQAGDQAAAATFVRGTQRDVWRLCAHLIDRDAADDLTQETYLRAFRALHRFAARSSARTWLLVIARRVCADHLREVQRGRARQSRLAADDAAERVPDVSDAVTLRALLAGLDPDRREAFVLTQVLGLPYAEAAQVCGCPVGTIRSRVARARDDLITALDAEPRTG